MQLWKCLGCDKQEMRCSSRATRQRCLPCWNKHRVGEGNPNFKDAGRKVCVQCGKEYKSYNKSRRFCSKSCAGFARPKKPKAEKPPKPPRERKPKKERGFKRGTRSVQVLCAFCGAAFQKFMSSSQRFCTYQCHLDSGGAWRAGIASHMATRKYGAKKDANHNEIVSAFEELGASVIDTSAMGGGFPDLIIGCCGVTVLVEIKNLKTSYGRQGLNKNQAKWKEQWTGGAYAVVSSVDMVKTIVQTIRTAEDAKTAARMV